MGRGAEGAEALRSMSRAYVAHMTKEVLQVMGPILRITIDELLILCQAVLSLLGEALPGDAVSSMKMKSSLGLAKSFVAQNSFWREQEKKYRETKVAVTTLVPEIKSLEKELLAGETSLHPADRLAKRLLVWDEALPEGEPHPAL